jgi:glycosyltransferase involved in cell wall biosynthesis
MPNQNKKQKIVLISDCLSIGGAEKVHARLSNYFESKNIEVYNVIFQDIVTYKYSGKLLNLGLMKSNTVFDKLKRLYFLRTYFLENKFDYAIDFRYRVNSKNEFLVSRFVYNCPSIYTVHLGLIDYYIPKNKFLANLIYAKHKIVCVSKAIQNRTNEFHNLETYIIYNPFNLKSIQNLNNKFVPEEKNYIIAIGRMNAKVKQLDKLIDSYSKSELPKKNIKLLILGDGVLKKELVNQAENLNLSDKIIFKGFQNNPYPYLKNAIFTVLSSLNEGLPNVLIESLANGTPVISFDCFSGPNEIIANEINGLLVEDQNVEKLTEAMNRFIDDTKLYQKCKDNSTLSVQKFSVEKIGAQWIDLMSLEKTI